MKRKANKFLSVLLILLFLFSILLTVNASDKSSTIPEEVQNTISLLNASDHGIPACVTKDDMQRVIKEGGKAGYDALSHILECTPPVEVPPITNIERNPNEGIENYSIAYNFKTGVEKRIKIDDCELPLLNNDELSMNDDKSIMPSLNVSLSVASDFNIWNTKDPQSYSDTRAAAKLLIKCRNGLSFVGSGFLVSKDTVVTAGHCIYSHTNGGWPEYITVIPSYSKDYTNGYYGNLTDADVVEVGSDWINLTDATDDWGIIKLSNSFSLNNYYEIWATTDKDHIVGWSIRTIGYPNYEREANMRNSYGNVIEIYTNSHKRLVHTNAWGEPGMSGGPILEGGKKVIGLVRGGPSGIGGECVFLKIDSAILSRINYYKNS